MAGYGYNCFDDYLRYVDDPLLDEEFNADEHARLCDCGHAVCTFCGNIDDAWGHAAILTDCATGETTVTYIDGDEQWPYFIAWDAISDAKPQNLIGDAITVRLSPIQIKEINHLYRCRGIRVYLAASRLSKYGTRRLWVCPWTEADEQLAVEHKIPVEAVAHARRCKRPISELIASYSREMSADENS